MMLGRHHLIVATGIFRNQMAAAGHQDHRQAMIELLRQSPGLSGSIDGVEIGFRAPEDLLSFRVDPVDRDYLRSLAENTCHFPYEHRITDDGPTRELLRMLRRVCGDVGIRNTVIHPHIVEDADFLFGQWRELGLGSMTFENWIRTKEISLAGFEALLARGEVGLTFDTCHAAIASLASLGFTFRYLLPRFERRVRYLHLSGVKLVRPFEDPQEPGIKQFCKGHHFIHELNRVELGLLEPVWSFLARNPSTKIVLEATARDASPFASVLQTEIGFVSRLVAEAACDESW